MGESHFDDALAHRSVAFRMKFCEQWSTLRRHLACMSFFKNCIRRVFFSARQRVQTLASHITTRQVVLVLGDSHAGVFNHAQIRKKQFANFYWDVCSVNGATVSGIENPNSITNAAAWFRYKIEKAPKLKLKAVIVLLGEVDCGFLAWTKIEAGKYENEVLASVVSLYLKFLSRVVSRSDAPVLVISTPLPTITDEAASTEVAQARRAISASRRQKTDFTRRFNEQISSHSRSMNYRYVNLDHMIDSDTGFVDDKFLNLDPSDHHYDEGAYSAFISKELLRLWV